MMSPQQFIPSPPLALGNSALRLRLCVLIFIWEWAPLILPNFVLLCIQISGPLRGRWARVITTAAVRKLGLFFSSGVDSRRTAGMWNLKSHAVVVLVLYFSLSLSAQASSVIICWGSLRTLNKVKVSLDTTRFGLHSPLGSAHIWFGVWGSHRGQSKKWFSKLCIILLLPALKKIRKLYFTSERKL